MIQKIETWLPVFPGFYNTIFDCDNDLDTELSYQNEDRSKFLPKLEYDDLEFDNCGYQQDVLEQCCGYIEQELNVMNILTKIDFQHVSSPKEYNFRNDSGNIEVSLSHLNTIVLKNYIYDHKESYEKYLKKTYTSYDGFWSYYNNDFDSWIEYTKDFSDFSDNSHYLGSILQFICENENITEENIYYSIEVYASGYCQDKRNQFKCEECGEWAEFVKFKEHNEYNKMVNKQTILWQKTQGDKPLVIKSFKDCYPEFYLLCEICKE